MRNLLEVDDLTSAELTTILEMCTVDLGRPYEGLGVALLFEKPSARTRNSMEMAVVQLGGHPVTIRPDEVGLDIRESVEDVTRTLCCYHAAIGARVFEHSKLERMCAVSTVPVVNMLSDTGHPLQALADLRTIADEFGLDSLAGRSVAFVGDGNNVARSLGIGAAMMQMSFRIATPAGYGLSDADLDRIAAFGGEVLATDDPLVAIEGADVVATDVWTSMGQEAESAQRRAAFAAFTVDDASMAVASPDAIFLHCLPAHRGEEVAASVIDGPRSRVWRQAENRMHTGRAALAWLDGQR